MGERTSEGYTANSGLEPNPSSKPDPAKIDAQLTQMVIDRLRDGIKFPAGVTTIAGLIEWIADFGQEASTTTKADIISAVLKELVEGAGLHRDTKTLEGAITWICEGFKELERLRRLASDAAATQLYAAVEGGSIPTNGKAPTTPYGEISGGPVSDMLSSLHASESQDPDAHHRRDAAAIDDAHTQSFADNPPPTQPSPVFAAELAAVDAPYGIKPGDPSFGTPVQPPSPPSKGGSNCSWCGEKMGVGGVGWCSLACQNAWDVEKKKMRRQHPDLKFGDDLPGWNTQAGFMLQSLLIQIHGDDDQESMESMGALAAYRNAQKIIRDGAEGVAAAFNRVQQLEAAPLDESLFMQTLREGLGPKRFPQGVDTLDQFVSWLWPIADVYAKTVEEKKAAEEPKKFTPWPASWEIPPRPEHERTHRQHPEPTPAGVGEFLQTLLETSDLDAPSAFEILGVCMELAIFLMSKNKAYGDSALDPVRILSSADPAEQLRVRMDDKLSRMMRGHAAGEDALKDLVGYWVLERVAEKRSKKK